MRSYQEWMDAYEVDHKNPRNRRIHKYCVPLIMLSIIGVLWALPRSYMFTISFNWALALIVPAIVFYLSLKKVRVFISMVLQTLLMCLICEGLLRLGVLLPVSVVIFVGAWVGQFVGHKIEGQKPSFLEDLTFLLIGPLWVNRFLFSKFKIKE